VYIEKLHAPDILFTLNYTFFKDCFSPYSTKLYSYH